MNSFTSAISSERESNVELLRIVSMILVLVTHACYVSLGPPTYLDISTSFCSSVVRALCESMSDVCVNIFVLISGWFGIRIRMKRFIGFVFQVLFINIILYVIMRLLGLTDCISLKGWVDLLLFKTGTYWFIKAYIVLYIFSPVLNTFVDYCNRIQLKHFLISFFIIQTIYGFYINTGWFSNGYSPLSFMGLYLLARYMRLYPSRFMKYSMASDIFIYISLSLITALLSLSLTFWCGKVGTVLLQNSSPLIIASSISFFLFFLKISINSRLINWVSISCFAAYCVHCSPFIFTPYYIDYIRYWSVSENKFFFLLYTSLLISVYFVISILFDKFRIFVWNSVCKYKRWCVF